MADAQVARLPVESVFRDEPAQCAHGLTIDTYCVPCRLETIEAKVNRLLGVLDTLDRFAPALDKLEKRLARSNPWKRGRTDDEG